MDDHVLAELVLRRVRKRAVGMLKPVFAPHQAEHLIQLFMMWLDYEIHGLQTERSMLPQPEVADA